MPFPPVPVRGVRVRYVCQTRCPADFADVTVDFAPGAPGVVVTAAAPMAEEFRAAFEAGVRDRLTALDPAATVVIRAVRVHEVDSREQSFRVAGQLAAREALTRLTGR